MILSLKEKEEIVHKIHVVAKKAVSAVVANLEGIRVNEITQLRKEARSVDVHVYVICNTLLCRAVEHTEFLCLKDVFIGQNIIAFSSQNPSDSARIFVKFSKKNESFKIKGAAFNGKFIDTSQISLLSNLPTYKESLFNLVTVMKMSSIGNLIRILHMLSITKNKSFIS